MKFHLNLDTFVISDSHFGHKAVLLKEPIRNVLATKNGFDDFDSYSVSVWNKHVGTEDFILHLGDLYFSGGYKYLSKLNGNKKLLVGNNDLKKYKLLKGYEDWSLCKKIKLKIDEKKTILQKLKSKWGDALKKDKLLNAIVIDMGIHRVMFSHFPVMSRKRNDRYCDTRDMLDSIYKICDCSLNIHGHTHSRDTSNRFCINVSGEKTEFIPVRIRDILALYS
ncbi:metallophosphoesterase [Helicobacter cappadocius]|uniref:Calcineurin-like phosphoesterase domain-containing protein n=1 Tax=Helicobacter cappadocius TaxID=3063998 RepID=A0AA90PIH3_9HELI|nr:MULTISPECIES: metallophosphoesterase [unclassified Helicobacter]MDO7252318.1 hypothetical protein [Helicobacter sp. faydin-H75]MDP2538185.1 hypothetical protein [Helicobacter sp. faydin-H76]